MSFVLYLGQLGRFDNAGLEGGVVGKGLHGGGGVLLRSVRTLVQERDGERIRLEAAR